MAKPVELHYTASPINTVEWTKLNENWDRIMSGFEAMRDQIRILAGGVEVDEILERINTAVENAEATTADMILLIVEANTKLSEITQAISESQEVTDTANNIINQLTTLKTELESLKAELEGITEAESTRVANENARIDAENVRKSNEDIRQFNEQTRQEQEEIRQQNEEDRQSIFDNQIQQINNVLPNVTNLENVQSWNIATQYYKNNIVEYNGSSFMALKDNKGQTPPILPAKQNEYWMLLAQRGVDGEGSVSSVNGKSPNVDGNVELTAEDIGAIPVSEKGVVGGVARLNEDGKVVDANGNEVEGKVKSVNGKTGDVQITSGDITVLNTVVTEETLPSEYPLGVSVKYNYMPENPFNGINVGYGIIETLRPATNNRAIQFLHCFRANGQYVDTYKRTSNDNAWQSWRKEVASTDITDSTTTDDSTKVASAKAVSTLNTNLTQLDQKINEHLADTVMHITNDERNQWNNMLPIVNTEYNVDPNTTLSGHILTNHINAPIPNRYWYIITLFYNSIGVDRNRTQIAMDYTTSNFAYRSYRDGTWSDWTIIGSKTNLNTTEKTIVGAINEVSNELDSFSEKGIWTPVVRGSTTFGNPVYEAREGEYVRNGSTVYVRARVLLSSKGGMSGNIEITGLPFAAGGGYRVATIGVHNNITYPSNAKDMSGYIESNVMRPYFNISGSASLTRLTANDVTDNMLLTFFAVYDV